MNECKFANITSVTRKSEASAISLQNTNVVNLIEYSQPISGLNSSRRPWAIFNFRRGGDVC